MTVARSPAGLCFFRSNYRYIRIDIYLLMCLFLYLQVVFLCQPKTYLPYHKWAVRDWQGGLRRYLDGGTASLILGTSSSYNTIGVGETFSWQNGKTGYFSIGQTTLIGEPYRADQIGNPNFSNQYLHNFGQH